MLKFAWFDKTHNFIKYLELFQVIIYNLRKKISFIAEKPYKT